MARTVTTIGTFFGISGEPTTRYYADHATAARVAAQMDEADIPTVMDPATTASEGEQNTAILAAGIAAAGALTAATTADTDAHAAATGATSAAAAAAAAQSTANTAQTAASAAASVANTAIDSAGAAQTTATAAGTAAAAAAGAAATAQSTANAVAAAVVPIFSDERFRVACKAIGMPGDSRLLWTDDPFQDGWVAYQGAHTGNENPSVANIDDGGSTSPNNIYPKSSLLGARVGVWYMRCIARFFGTVGVGSGEWRAMVATDHQDTFSDYFGVGLFENISPDHFSFLTIGDAGVKSAISTVAYAPGTHQLDLRRDQAGNFSFAVDGETPIALAVTASDFPDGGMQVVFTNKLATQKTFVDAFGVAQSRINAGP
jgi:hypothetical protein